MSTTEEKKTISRSFEAEVKQVLDLVIHSLYSNKDIFLRELISNASDALDKLRIQSISDQSLMPNSELQIKISINKENKKLIIEDNGIGMNEEELINNLGTIAKSGTKDFINTLKTNSENKGLNSSLIGQFGVGFYSAFMVAKKIQVLSKKAGEEKLWSWTSTGESSYEIEEIDKNSLENNLENGSRIILDLNEASEDYLESFKIRQIVKKYSDFIEYPIKLLVENFERNSKLTQAKNAKDDAERLKLEAEAESMDEMLWEKLNSQKAIWARPKNEIKKEEYDEFYHHLTHDFQETLECIHYSAEGTNEFKALLYIPSRAPFDMFLRDDSKEGLHLYINRVFITKDQDLLIPSYLRFVKGVIDSSDLPLNVSRELLQSNPKINNIKKNISKKILTSLSKIKNEDRKKYTEFYKEFSKVIKEGVHSDPSNKDSILDLLLFETNKTTSGEFTSLQEYLDRAQTRQNEKTRKEIYYICGESRSELENSPYLEAFKAKDIEVLFMTEPIDEWLAITAKEFKESHFKSITQGEVDLEENKEEKEKFIKEKEEKHKNLLAKMQDLLKEKVEKIKFSDRLVETLCCLVTEEGSMSANMEKLYRAANQTVFQSVKRILELNPNHSVVMKLEEIFSANPEDYRIANYTELIYDQALLMEGSKIEDPVKFSKLVSELMK
jgi:molecular chaperone HtpG